MADFVLFTLVDWVGSAVSFITVFVVNPLEFFSDLIEIMSPFWEVQSEYMWNWLKLFSGVNDPFLTVLFIWFGVALLFATTQLWYSECQRQGQPQCKSN